MDAAISSQTAVAFDAAAPSPAPGASLTLRGLAKRFGETRVLERLDLHVPAGQFVGVVGRSGCGKSTLLRLVAGLDAPDDGRVALAGEARMMFQEPRLLPWLSVLANVEVGLGLERGRPDAFGQAQRALEAVGLVDRAPDWPSVLSGGQKQRVALARALVSRPRLLALDEPLGALDALTRIEMQRLLERVWLKERFTAMLVTHDVSEAIALADRIVLIESGAIALDARVDLPRPRHRGDPAFGALEARILARLLDEA
jgi:sulfonate transport system ATP-binding protein